MRMTLLIMFIFGLYGNNVYAKDFGQYGEIFDISEPDLLSQIEGKLQYHKNTGNLEAFQERYTKELKEQIMRPHQVMGIVKTDKEKYRKFDPTTELEEDIVVPEDNGGFRILYTKGTKINPLDYMKFDEPLIFIDGDDKAQTAFANEYFDKEPKSTIILVNGNPGIRKFGEKEYYYYFDQWGGYSSRFNIIHVPSVVYQEGDSKTLTVWEVKLS